MDTAKKLRILRRERKLSQENVAAAMGLDRTTYVKYENGSSIKQNLQKLADFFGVSTDYLLGREDAPTLVLEHITEPKSLQNEILYGTLAREDTFTESELEHLKKYHLLTSEQKSAIDCLTSHYIRLLSKEAL